MWPTVLGFWDFWWIGIVVLIALSGISTFLKPKDQARLRRLESKIDLLIKHAGLANESKVSIPPDVLEALQRGDKIGAIKCYREATGAGLAEAKQQVEAMQASENL